MAQTRRKRRTKHRGTAAGTIEARGRTGRKPRPEEKRAGQSKARGPAQRQNKPPSWRSAFGKAAFGAVLLFAFMQLGLLGDKASLASSLTLCLFALAAYTPVMYMTDRFLYQRRLRKEQGGR